MTHTDLSHSNLHRIVRIFNANRRLQSYFTEKTNHTCESQVTGLYPRWAPLHTGLRPKTHVRETRTRTCMRNLHQIFLLFPHNDNFNTAETHNKLA